jgi:hypothetical protein
MLSQALQYLYPDASARLDYRLQDDSDGRGPYIAYWNEAKLGQLPTQAKLDSAGAAAESAAAQERTRKEAIDQAIAGDTTVQSLKSMTNAEFDTWWSANVTNAAQAIALLKRITRVVLRRLL